MHGQSLAGGLPHGQEARGHAYRLPNEVGAAHLEEWAGMVQRSAPNVLREAPQMMQRSGLSRAI